MLKDGSSYLITSVCAGQGMDGKNSISFEGLATGSLTHVQMNMWAAQIDLVNFCFLLGESAKVWDRAGGVWKGWEAV